VAASFLKLWAPRSAPQEVLPGQVYSRQRGDGFTEMATVMVVRGDALGIAHVSFSLTFEKPAFGSIEGGERVLSLGSFTSTFRHRVR
jgi:hypothetical protein